ncbi:TPA: hypothetical protein ACPVZG_000191 [Vibrio parahaemolyticus]
MMSSILKDLWECDLSIQQIHSLDLVANSPLLPDSFSSFFYDYSDEALNSLGIEWDSNYRLSDDDDLKDFIRDKNLTGFIALFRCGYPTDFEFVKGTTEAEMKSCSISSWRFHEMVVAAPTVEQCAQKAIESQKVFFDEVRLSAFQRQELNRGTLDKIDAIKESGNVAYLCSNCCDMLGISYFASAENSVGRKACSSCEDNSTDLHIA